MKLLAVTCLCMALCVSLASCAGMGSRAARGPKHAGVNATAYPDSEVDLFKPCTAKEAQAWAANGDKDPVDMLRSAGCYVTLVAKAPENGNQRLSLAQKGREQAERACVQFPSSAMAHYLNAYLSGLVAENDPLQGLKLVHVIEREALLAAELDPYLDNGGPERMLGELYTKAPGYPVSIGDTELGVEHYRKAVAISPKFVNNRLGLVEALMKDDENAEACHELHALISMLAGSHPNREQWDNTLEMMKNFCYQY